MTLLAAIDPLVGVLIAAIVGPLGAYFVAVRKFSGKIGSSDATELWKESGAIREWSSSRMGELREDVQRLESRVGLVEGQNAALAQENANLILQIRELGVTITELRAEIVVLTTDLRTSHLKVADLEDESRRRDRRSGDVVTTTTTTTEESPE